MKKILPNEWRPLRRRPSNSHSALLVSVLIWLAVVVAGLVLLWSYESTPGVAAAAPIRWPADSKIKPASGQATLIMLSHPKCPCTRASLEELDKLMAHCQGRVQAYVVLMKPNGFLDQWVETDLWRNALKIPGVSVLVDSDGVESRRFRAATSGQVVVYGADGQLLFSGGITGSRGHSGDNAGRAAIESLLNTGTANDDHSPVFGCPLFNPDAECRSRAYANPGN